MTTICQNIDKIAEFTILSDNRIKIVVKPTTKRSEIYDERGKLVRNFRMLKKNTIPK